MSLKKLSIAASLIAGIAGAAELAGTKANADPMFLLHAVSVPNPDHNPFPGNNEPATILEYQFYEGELSPGGTTFMWYEKDPVPNLSTDTPSKVSAFYHSEHNKVYVFNGVRYSHIYDVENESWSTTNNGKTFNCTDPASNCPKIIPSSSNTAGIDANTTLIQGNEGAINLLNTKTDANDTNIQENAGDINTNANAINQNLDSINNNKSELESQLTKITNNTTLINSFNSSISANTGSLNENNGQIISNKARIDLAETRVSKNETDISNNITNISSNTNAIQDNLTKTTKNKDDILTLQAASTATNTLLDISISDHNERINANKLGVENNSLQTIQNKDKITNNEGEITILKSRTGNGNVIMTENGIQENNTNLISRNSDGVISIGTNSVKFGKEVAGNQSMWAEDENGIVDINITNGTDLKINGVSVQGQINDNKSAIQKNTKAIDTNRTNINNLGDGIAASTALSSALSALPVTPDDAPFSCGVGSGAYSSRFAMGLGCVAKVNQRLSVNVGGSHVFGSSSNYGGGSLDTVAVRGGFVFKLGKIDSPAATNEQLQSQLDAVKQENAAIKARYSTIEEQNKALMARLERLEAIALGHQPATTTASVK